MFTDPTLSREEAVSVGAPTSRTASKDGGNPCDRAELFCAVTISATGDERIYIGRFSPADPTWTYWTALDAACEHLDGAYPGWQQIAASREFYPEFVKVTFMTGAHRNHAEL